MGDIADAMLEGVMCEACGDYLEQEGDGVPDYCSADCAMDRGADWWLQNNGYKQLEDGRWVKSRNRKSKYD